MYSCGLEIARQGDRILGLGPELRGESGGLETGGWRGISAVTLPTCSSAQRVQIIGPHALDVAGGFTSTYHQRLRGGGGMASILASSVPPPDRPSPFSWTRIAWMMRGSTGKGVGHRRHLGEASSVDGDRAGHGRIGGTWRFRRAGDRRSNRGAPVRKQPRTHIRWA